MRYIKVEDYFGDMKPGMSSYDRQKLQELRDTLNGLRTTKEQAQYLKQWRSFPKNREWDYKVLGLDRNFEIDPNDLRSVLNNKYYKRHVSQMDRYFDMDKESKKAEKKRLAERQKELDKKAASDKKKAERLKQEAEEAKKEAEEAEKEAQEIEKAESSREDTPHRTHDEDDGDSRVARDDDNNNSFIDKTRRAKNKIKEGKDKIDDARKKAEKAKKMAEDAQKAADAAEKAAEASSSAAEAGAAAEGAGAAAAGAEGAAAAGAAEGGAAAAAGGGAAAAGEGAAAGGAVALKYIAIAILVIIVIILLINLIIFLVGGFGAMFGATPFATCDSVDMDSGFNINDDRFKKTVTLDNGNEYSLPANVWWYSDKEPSWFSSWTPQQQAELGYWYEESRSSTGVGAVLQYYYGEDLDRGRGVFCAEDYAWNPPHTDPYGVEMHQDAECWSINVRWEYVWQKINCLEENYVYGSGAGDLNAPHNDEILSSARSDSDGMWDYTINARYLVVNPETGKACICYAGDGSSDCNWGPGLGNRYGGLTQNAMTYLGYSFGNTDKYLEVYFIDVEDPSSIQAGPYTGISLSNGNGCSGARLNVIDTTSAANAASSLSWGGLSGTSGWRDYAYHSIGVDGYYEFLDDNLYGDCCGYYGCCASFVSAILINQGMIDFPKYYEEHPDGYGWLNPRCPWGPLAYMRAYPDEWEHIYPEGPEDIMPGDVVLWCDADDFSQAYCEDYPLFIGSEATYGHIAIVGAGEVPGGYELCQASLSDPDHCIGYGGDNGCYAAWATPMTSVTTWGNKDGSGRYVEYWRFIGTGNGNSVNP